ncbi:2-Hydroxyacid oxidase 1-like [Rhipicephalus sanguineus]|uniref:2-Hydroxyacid oxidase 1-like n=1 Tax=Rhipicephalus sanguineus TaxID=34632 RepID=UPI001894FBAF|nr:2-Hydroxyacid oxidase 1-like [Rhipicephalus sanguineus]
MTSFEEAAQDSDTVMILSSYSTVSLEDVRAAAPGCILWQQTYIYRDRSITQSLVERAAAMGFSAIVVTADAPVHGDGVQHHKYLYNLPHGLSFLNIEAAFSSGVNECEPRFKSSHVLGALPSATWDDIEWLRRLSKLPVVVKGVLNAEAALAAYRHGAAAVIVSNHGGRQLDATPATIDILPEVVAAVGDKMEVYLDSGVRTGGDVVKALALGARAVFVGRPVLWGLAYDGKQGVDRVLQILREELERTMQLLGCSDIRDLCEDFVVMKNHCLGHCDASCKQ